MKTKAQNYTVNNVFRTTQILNTNYTITNMIICNCNLIIIDMHVHANFILTNQFLMLVYLIVLQFFVNHVIQCNRLRFVLGKKGPGGSMSQVVGLPNNSYKPITNTSWVRARFVNYKKGALDSQPEVIKFPSSLPMVGGSLRVLRLLPPLKLVVMIQLKYC